MEEVTETKTEEKVISADDFTIGYVVGLTPDGNFVFEVVGKNKEVVGLMGIHKYAEYEVKKAFEGNRMCGDALTFEVGKAVAAVATKLDTLLKVTPSNKL